MPKKIMLILKFFFIFTIYITINCFSPDEREAETFNDGERPFFQYNPELNYYFCEPWNYYEKCNRGRVYPLVVFLHGSGGAGNISYLNYLGYDSNDGHDDPKAKKFQIEHPSFVLIPQTSGSWDNSSIITLIESFKSIYRIDTDCIYLIGYSMGGSGSYSLSNDYYDYNGTLFAGIIRLAGQSQTVVRNAISEKTSIWMHIGLDDDAVRIQVTRDAYTFLKTYHSTAAETTVTNSNTGYEATTLTLTKNGIEVAKKTEYVGVGHGIATLPFNDEYLIKWLYSQTIR